MNQVVKSSLKTVCLLNDAQWKHSDSLTRNFCTLLEGSNNFNECQNARYIKAKFLI